MAVLEYIPCPPHHPVDAITARTWAFISAMADGKTYAEAEAIGQQAEADWKAKESRGAIPPSGATAPSGAQTEG